MKVFAAIKKGPVRDGFITKENEKLLRDNFDVTFCETKDLDEEKLTAALCDGYDAVLTGWGSPLIENCSSLRLVAHTGGSVGDIVDEKVFDCGVRVISANSIYAEKHRRIFVSSKALMRGFPGRRYPWVMVSSPSSRGERRAPTPGTAGYPFRIPQRERCQETI